MSYMEEAKKAIGDILPLTPSLREIEEMGALAAYRKVLIEQQNNLERKQLALKTMEINWWINIYKKYSIDPSGTYIYDHMNKVIRENVKDQT